MNRFNTPELISINMYLARYWKKEGEFIRCELCPRRCIIPEGKVGFCRVRKNIGGKLYSLVYGKPSSIGIDPIEKKPFYHFYPGTKTLSFATVGCNFRCKFCCNWEISQAEVNILPQKEVLPKEIVEMAEKEKVQGIAYTYIEPTIFFEYAFDTAKIAKPKGFYNVFVTNGYAMERPLNDIKPYLDAVVIDFKGNNEKFYREYSSAELEEVKRGVLKYKKIGVHIEITNLIVPGLNDNLDELREFANWIKEKLGKDTPYHILRYFPTYKMQTPPPTPVEILKKVYDVSKEEGLNYVYIGNIEETKYNNTYCPTCGELLIERQFMQTTKINLTKDNRCPKCGTKIPIVR